MSGETRVYRAIALGRAIITSIDRTQLVFSKEKNKEFEKNLKKDLNKIMAGTLGECPRVLRGAVGSGMQ